MSNVSHLQWRLPPALFQTDVHVFELDADKDMSADQWINKSYI